MVNLYVSFAPDDTAQFVELMKWVRPLVERHYLRVWHNRPTPKTPPLPMPWRVLLFWYSPPIPPALPHHPDLAQKAAEAHVYLFLTSPKWLQTSWVHEVEIPTALQRHTQYGDRLVRLLPVEILPSEWRTKSRLGNLSALAPGKPLSQYKDTDEGYKAFTHVLDGILEEVRRNHIEETHFQGGNIQPFFELPKSVPPPPPPPPLLPDWLGWVIVGVLLYTVMNGYAKSCTPPPSDYQVPYDKPPVEFRRVNPMRPPPDSVWEGLQRDTLLKI